LEGDGVGESLGFNATMVDCLIVHRVTDKQVRERLYGDYTATAVLLLLLLDRC